MQATPSIDWAWVAITVIIAAFALVGLVCLIPVLRQWVTRLLSRR